MTDSTDLPDAGPTSMPVLRTARLAIRPLTSDDLEACHQLYQAIGWADPDLSDAESRVARGRWLDWTVRSYGGYASVHQPPYGERAVTSRAGEFLGLVGVVPCLAPFGQLPGFGGQDGARASAEVGLFWALNPQAQGQGFATEAAGAVVAYLFDVFRLGRVVATTERENLASQAVMRRLGMRLEENPFSEPPWLEVVGVLEAGKGGQAPNTSAPAPAAASARL